jgi:hypothetical protein
VLSLLPVGTAPVGPAIGLLVALTLMTLMPLVALPLVGLALAANPLGDHIPVPDGEQDLDLVQLVPLGVGPLPLGDREELLEAGAGRIRRLRLVHPAIIAWSIREGRAGASPW